MSRKNGLTAACAYSVRFSFQSWRSISLVTSLDFTAQIENSPLPGPGQCASSRVRWNRIKCPEPPRGYAFTSASAEVRERTGLVSLIYVQEDPDRKPGGNCGARDSRLP